MHYVEQIDGGYQIAGTRVSLDSLVYAYANGQTAESIAQSFPALTLEQVHGALAFYLSHRSEVDAYLRHADVEYNVQRESSRSRDPMFYQKLVEARRAQHSA